MNRVSGILAHPTSMPSKYGIGDLGKGCYDFIDFLYKAEQTIWQVFPLGPTSFGDSPYQSFSTFAGNPLLISLDMLKEEGLLKAEDLELTESFNEDKVEYGRVIEFKNNALKKAYSSFKKKRDKALKDSFKAFKEENKLWLEDYCLFVAIKNYYIESRKNLFEPAELKAYRKQNEKTMSENSIMDCFYGACFNSWEEDISLYKKSAVTKWKNKLKDEIEFFAFCQFEFFQQWGKVKAYANERGIKIIGDIPIFVAADSADVWTRRELFCLDEKGYPTEVAGVPPDYFSATGQLWGNPLYNWEVHKKDGYKWWIERIKNMYKIADVVRIDHFRAFESYWSIPYGSENAIKGEWKKGPNKEIFDVIKKELGKISIIAEDLGDLNEEVKVLRDKLGLAGMKILQFAFSDTSKNDYLPHNYKSSNFVVYTGTHDNDTTLGWYKSLDEKSKDYLRRYLNVSGEDIAWDMIRLAFSSCADYAIIPVQDLLSLDTDARMNTPGVAEGNWQFRFKADSLTDSIAEGLRYLNELYNRNADFKPLEEAKKGAEDNAKAVKNKVNKK